MWPWAHAAFGYLLYRLGLSVDGDRPTGPAVLALAVGTQFPDLVDKPLAWTLAVLPSGRSLAHSAITATLVISVALFLTRRTRRDDRPARAFAVGYLSHLLGDALEPLVEADPEFLTFLVWPLLPPPPYESDSGFLEHVLAFSFTPAILTGFALTAVALVVWVRDGVPGLGTLRRLVAFRGERWR